MFACVLSPCLLHHARSLLSKKDVHARTFWQGVCDPHCWLQWCLMQHSLPLLRCPTTPKLVLLQLATIALQMLYAYGWIGLLHHFWLEA